MTVKKPAFPGPYEDLRRMLAGWEPAEGTVGFEGLIATALAEFTGHTFRLARSGTQFGRDAATPMAPFAIAMEAKRYKDSIGLNELAGKASIAALYLADRIDAWTLAATVEINPTTLEALEMILGERGIFFVTLDWGNRGVPALAVLLASAKAPVLPFAESIHGKAFRDELERHLVAVEADSSFGPAVAALRDHLGQATFGLGGFANANDSWVEQHLSNRKLAQRDFAQYAAPLDVERKTITRTATMSAIDRAIIAARANDKVVAVLGGEGCGKTWVTLQWWHAQQRRPILFLSIGQIANLLDSADSGLTLLAKLAALQDGDRRTEEHWLRRLNNWSVWTGPRDRFVVLIDGLNEFGGKPWTTLIRRLGDAIAELGGVLIVTCRNGYWDREIKPRLGASAFEEVPVNDYDDQEFEQLMRLNGIRAAELPPEIDRFMRNPRTCDLAIRLRSRLPLSDLSIERLLLEYWRDRLEERGDLIAHNDDDFNTLLRNHARVYRAKPGTSFNRDDWRSQSGAAQRADGRDLCNDLSDIEEGRFFDSAKQVYAFKPEALRFALGLLLTGEITGASKDNAAEATQISIDAVRGFDIVADVVAAAILIACNDKDYPDHGIAALVNGLLSLQNVSDEIFDRILPAFCQRPDAFFDAYEKRDLSADDRRFLELLLEAAQRQEVSVRLAVRLPVWLGTWSRKGTDYGPPEKRQEHADRRNERIDERLSCLTSTERTLFDKLCSELEERASVVSAAAYCLVGVPQAALADAIVGFAFATAVAGTHETPTEIVAWAIRLNRIDHEKFAAAVNARMQLFFVADASQTAKSAAAIALRLLGTVDGARLAEVLAPLKLYPGRNRRNNFCAVDPRDPAAEKPDNISNAVGRLGSMERTEIWNHMSSTAEDMDLKEIAPQLARFEHAPIIHFLEELARSIVAREGMPLRQLGWHLPWMGPLLGEKAQAAVRETIRKITANPLIVPGADADFVLAMLVEALLPHLGAEEQLDLIQSLPAETPFYLRFGDYAKKFEANDAAQRIAAALATGDTRRIERTLSHLAMNPPGLSDALREQLKLCLANEDEAILGSACELASLLDDPELHDRILLINLPDEKHANWYAMRRRRAFAAAAVRRRREDLLDQIPADYLDWAAHEWPAALERLSAVIEQAIDVLLDPVDVAPPRDALVELHLDDDRAAEGLYGVEDKGEEFDNPMEGLQSQLSDADGSRFAERRALLNNQLEQFIERLAIRGASIMMKRPQMYNLEPLAAKDSARMRRWIERILAVRDERLLRQVQNLGVSLAEGFSRQDSELAARLFEHLWKIEPHLTITIGKARLKLRDLALFTAPASFAIRAIRAAALRRAKNDGEIEDLVLAGSAAGAADWLRTHARQLAASPLPADQALGLTIASFLAPSGESEDLLNRNWSSGFLSLAAETGRRRYEKAGWARHWLEAAKSSNSREEAWRMMELAVTSADRRILLELDPELYAFTRATGGELVARLIKAGEKRSGEAGKTLYGTAKPNNLVSALVG